ncbi:cyanophycinase [Hymenobacter sp. BT770]|uniref:cyanophycinase n=1 Tax=Hymenobacter sp. BT770 TaxID=2886942 RepID=UPI001D1147FF|nr:cyanophycinase [Hymenobacter sp. BT770]MCC3154901.1 cyanophycinase [Hymenobacter sp. BT770]MDO3417349.1 cyanophycinase [Hymenobacter sp. BT770]
MPTPKKVSSEKACPPPRGILIAIGGHEDKTPNPGTDPEAEYAPDAILRRFVDELRGKGPVIVVPIASEDPKEAAKDYVDVFKSLGVDRVEVFDVRERAQALDEAGLELLNEAAGIMFTGGDQLRLTALLGGTPWLNRLKERYTHDEIVIAGTSAGAAAMSTPMIYQGRDNQGMRKDEIHITTGLRFLHDVAIDTHFVARGRIIRMAQIIATNPSCIGLGLEEDTGVVVTQGREIEVIGSGVVTVVEALTSTTTNIHLIKPGEPFTIRDLRVHILSNGERYTLPVQEDMHS